MPDACPKCMAARANLYRATDYYGAYWACRRCGYMATSAHVEPDDGLANHKRRPSFDLRRTLKMAQDS